MLTQDTKRHIDAARQILVGVVPNPASQIDQITNALIYKFMDDMDQSAIEAGGKPSFFVGDLERYAWTRLIDPRLGNQERMNLYAEALVKFSEAKQLPQLFRDIFKSAFLPHRSPEVLGLFLKEIDYFDYSHSEELGNAYEYLLSIMGSQGDAGQFRTPRHIIDFIVDTVDPSKDDKILDPACGTGGFLISAYKNILAKHDGEFPTEDKPLTPDQRRKLLNNFEGYDVDPGMVRIAQVNMYLHHFRSPKIYNYNTLSDDDRWADKFDVILANPPFMSPKGGVSTHNKFSVPSNRSEVLFVDYIMSHLRPKGRAGIIVPEGIIFQSTTAHRQLRKNLVEDGLYAVVSLPSGVFQPYSGVKTSVLLFNNSLAKTVSEILFVKIENDGFDLGAQRRKIEKNDLPEALQIVRAWNQGKKKRGSIALWVRKDKISKSGDYNLSGDRYKEIENIENRKWPIVPLGDLCNLVGGGTPSKSDEDLWKGGNIKWLSAKHIDTTGKIAGYDLITEKAVQNSATQVIPKGSIIYVTRVSVGKTAITDDSFAINQDITALLIKDTKQVETRFLYYVLKSQSERIISLAQGLGVKGITRKDFANVRIPLPSLVVQQQITAELDGYQSIISGARQIVDSWKPNFDVDPQWSKVKLGEVCNPEYGFTETAKDSGKVRFIRITDISPSGELICEGKKYIDLTENSKKYLLEKGDLLVARTGATFGKTLLFNSDEPSVFASFLIRIRFSKMNILPEYYWAFSQSDLYWTQANSLVTGGGQPQFNGGALKQIEIPIPPIEVQKQIVEKINFERGLVQSAKKLIELYEQKTKDVLSKLWAE